MKIFHSICEEGKAAHAAGKMLHDCPYPQESDERELWIMGWQDAEMEIYAMKYGG